jgi:hypothetical protein
MKEKKLIKILLEYNGRGIDHSFNLNDPNYIHDLVEYIDIFVNHPEEIRNKYISIEDI